MTSTSYLDQPVSYGGLVVTRGHMIADLMRTAEANGHDAAAVADRYLQGHTYWADATFADDMVDAKA